MVSSDFFQTRIYITPRPLRSHNWLESHLAAARGHVDQAALDGLVREAALIRVRVIAGGL